MRRNVNRIVYNAQRNVNATANRFDIFAGSLPESGTYLDGADLILKRWACDSAAAEVTHT